MAANTNATISQRGAGGEAIGSKAVITQTATSFAYIYQGVSLPQAPAVQNNPNMASITQVAGINLKAWINQGDVQLADAANNPIPVTGLNGVAVVLTSTITNDNTAGITQTSGDKHNDNIFQNGRFNTATVTQNGGNGAQALIIQTANSQRASATISQTSTGTGNAATILQYVGSNADGQGQFGNMASISQISVSNNVAFIQEGIQGSASSSNDN